jgi:hypothetical protein
MRLHTPLGERDPLLHRQRPVEPRPPNAPPRPVRPYNPFIEDGWEDVTHIHYDEETGELVA